MFNKSDTSACVVIPAKESDDGDVVFQPGPSLPLRTGGEYRVEMGRNVDLFGDAFSVINQSCKVGCPDPPALFEGCSRDPPTAGRCCLEQEANGELCNQLVFKPGVRTGLGGEFVIQYVPEGLSEPPINITVQFSKYSLLMSQFMGEGLWGRRATSPAQVRCQLRVLYSSS